MNMKLKKKNTFLKISQQCINRYKHCSRMSMMMVVFCFGILQVYGINSDLSDANSANIQQNPIVATGLVKDVKGEPLVGVLVKEKGTSNATTTDINGNYRLSVSSNAKLVFNYLGHVPVEISAGSEPQTIALVNSVSDLDEVVVVGYGSQKKVTLTGAVVAISGDEILTTKNENVENMITGKIPGVIVVQKSGEPGSYNSKFQIRGMGNPLYIIDGVARDNMSRIDPNDIESLSVLKDASAAIYGVRAANGVVLITTKKGKGGRTQFEYSGSVGWQRASGLPKTGNALDYMTLMNEDDINNGRPLSYSKEQMDEYRNGTKRSTDWGSVGIKETAPQTQHSISATGGSEKVTYYTNFGYLKQDGFWKSGSLNYERFNIRTNLSAQLTKGLKAEVFISGMKDTKNQPYRDPWLVYKSIWTQVPLWPVYANDNPEYLYNAADADHPLVITDSELNGYKKYENKSFQSTFALEYDIPFIDGLKARAMYSYDYYSYVSKEFSKAYTLYTYDAGNDTYKGSQAQSPSKLKRSFKEKPTTTLQLQLNYARTFAKNHNVSALAVYEETTAGMDNFYAERFLSMDAVDQLYAGNAKDQNANMAPGDLWKDANKGLIGRVNYDFSSKYLAEFSFRYDGSSKFAPGSQWGFFPAGSLGWRLSEESFFKNVSKLSFVDNLKIRGSYGLMGDDNASSYQFLSGYNYPSEGFVQNGEWVNALGMRGLPNPYITWYKAKALNIGIDVDMWNGLLGFQTEYFSRKRDGLLAKRNLSLPGTVGAVLPDENLNSDLTNGFEIALTHRNKINDFSYYASGNVSYTRTKNEYVERSASGNSYRNWRDNTTNRYNDIWWGLGYLGQFGSYQEAYNAAIQDSKGNSILRPGDYQYDDWNGDGVIDENDEHPIATKEYPKINFGLSLGGEYKGFDLMLLLQGAAMSNVKYPEQLERPLSWGRNSLNMFMDRWHLSDPTDPNSEWISGYYPSTNRGESTNYRDSERSVQNASYIRLKTIEFGYNLPKSLITRMGVRNVRIYFSGYNLLTFTGIKNLDPEHPSDTYGYLYPLTKTYNFGLNVSF